ncbi:MAG: HutD family protein [Clostridia bacterium]|nr:HutD family protein [Clostridia bacterium]
MTVSRLTSKDYRTSRWSGGETTELLIWPRDAVYGQRNFLFRVSSATVELDESTFTALPDYHRLIATLEGTITLRHDGGAPLTLAPYQVHAFDGGSETVSLGRCRDFNLMLRKGKATGSLTALTADATPLSVPPDRATAFALLFCAEGRCTVTVDGVAYGLSSGESLLLETPAACPLSLQGAARLMLAQATTL